MDKYNKFVFYFFMLTMVNCIPSYKSKSGIMKMNRILMNYLIKLKDLRETIN